MDTKTVTGAIGAVTMAAAGLLVAGPPGAAAGAMAGAAVGGTFGAWLGDSSADEPDSSEDSSDADTAGKSLHDSPGPNRAAADTQS